MAAKDLKSADSEVACAKINLALHVRRKLPNGYHELETVFAFVDCGDVVSVKPGKGISLSIIGPCAEGLSNTDNLVLDAARLLASHSDQASGADIILDKRLPVASGIGGGSADAAATLRLLNRFWNTELSISQLAALSEPLGADVPACVLSETCVGKGIGQHLLPIENRALKSHHALLINPRIPVSTAAVFADWDGIDRGALQGGDVKDMALFGRNDLQEPAERLAPLIGDILIELDQTDPIVARMSGSGATCFALYETAEEAAAAEQDVKLAMPDAWTMIGGLK
ncbi:4-(cytidine 5'-diphospho)-2-C-methyl-D-erythritol kinase [Sphingorhabdus sp. Alg231-15]|uniref:4-(cytidine 5'-diphospho)-2-C-methyl-D-erythritol kinase n=1 Tax=Sphingorhabdus sp. Alg231-15 TaxID=1922222 RepID=UPI000D5519F4